MKIKIYFLGFASIILLESSSKFISTDLIPNLILIILSHQKIMAKLMVCELNSTDLIPDDWIKISKLKFDDYPIHRLMEKMVESIDL